MKEMSLSSAGAQRQSAETAKASMKISIIVPVLNEGERLRPFLEHLRERAPSAEVILVNAVGSQTVSERAVALCDRVLTIGRGRAAQMNAGANAASGEVFWVVHADSQVPPGCLEVITPAVQDRKVVVGGFRIRFQRRSSIYRACDAGGLRHDDLFCLCC